MSANTTACKDLRVPWQGCSGHGDLQSLWETAHEPVDSVTAGALLDWRFPGSFLRTDASPYSV